MNARSLLITATLLALGCARGPQADLSVSARAATTSASSPGTASAADTTAALDLGNGISVDRVRVVVRRLKLEAQATSSDGGVAGVIRSSASRGSDDGSGSSSDSGSSGRDGGDDGSGGSDGGSSGSSGGGGDDLDETVMGPLLADLSAATIAGGLQQIFQGQVPAGTYRELKIAIGTVGADEAKPSELDEMATRHASVIVHGTVDGAEFEFVSGLTAELELEGEIVVSADKSNNITLSVDPKTWFGGAGAARLDPRDEASRSAIENNIKASIRGFEDDDHSGQDDHGGSGSGGGDDAPGHH